MIQTIEQLADLRSYVSDCKAQGQKVSLVPTMGALHEGHLELVRQGLMQADICIVSIFVNPAQFAPHEDFDNYPRTLEKDIAKLQKIGTQAVWLPHKDLMYPQDFVSNIHVGGVSAPLEGVDRPHFFGGVATVVTKLFMQVMPDIALFGEKDYQQLQVIKRMVRDLDIPLEIIGVPIIRDENGLALSSRNAYLSKEEYKIAAQLNKVLFGLAKEIKAGGNINELCASGEKELIAAGFDHIDYLEVRDAENLREPQSDQNDLRILAAVKLGNVRLIDNVAV